MPKFNLNWLYIIYSHIRLASSSGSTRCPGGQQGRAGLQLQAVAGDVLRGHRVYGGEGVLPLLHWSGPAGDQVHTEVFEPGLPTGHGLLHLEGRHVPMARSRPSSAMQRRRDILLKPRRSARKALTSQAESGLASNVISASRATGQRLRRVRSSFVRRSGPR